MSHVDNGTRTRKEVRTSVRSQDHKIFTDPVRGGKLTGQAPSHPQAPTPSLGRHTAPFLPMNYNQTDEIADIQ
jgi:hypothetical protein